MLRGSPSSSPGHPGNAKDKAKITEINLTFCGKLDLFEPTRATVVKLEAKPESKEDSMQAIHK